MNLFGTVLTHPPSAATERIENELTRAPLQRVTLGRLEHPGIPPEAIRNALRESLRRYGLSPNRPPVHPHNPPAVRREDYADPQRWADDPERWADDYFFGYFVANPGDIPADVVNARDVLFARDTLWHIHLAVALEPYRHDVGLTPSQVAATGFQYPFAINLNDLRMDDPATPPDGVMRPDGGTYRTRGEQRRDWLRYVLRGLSELNAVPCTRARSAYEMAPASIVVRLTLAPVAGYDLYAFQPDGSLPEVIDAVLHSDFPGDEFVLGGDLVRDVLAPEIRLQLRRRGVALYRRAAQALDAVARRAAGAGFLPAPADEVA